MYQQLYPNLLKPLRLKGLVAKNRMMSAPNMLFQTVDGKPTEYYIRYLEHKARGGAGIVTLGEVPVCDGGCHTPGFDLTQDNLPLFAEMSAAIHEHGALASVELTHGGLNARPQFNHRTPMGPDAMTAPDGHAILAMTDQDMDEVADAFASATEFWYHAGFDMVLLHMAHGWLFTQFLSPLRNHRTDAYGGSLENRMRFPLMVLKRIRDWVGHRPVVAIRLSGSGRATGDFTADDMITFLEQAQEYVDLVEVSSELLTYFMASTYMPHGLNADLSEAIKQSGRVHIPVFSIGSILDPAQAEEIISCGKADGVSLSRALIADPYFPAKARENRSDEITPCLRCLNCTDSDNLDRHFVCSVNPLIGREARLGFGEDIGKAKVSKNVVVIGGGPAGMQAALTAAERGHSVTLVERDSQLGGLLNFTDHDSLKHDLHRFKAFLVRRTLSSPVEVRLNTEASDALIAALRPDSILVATGSTPLVPTSILGIAQYASHAMSVYLSPETVQGKTVIIIGGGLVGVEVGLHLANLGKCVTILEMQNEYAPEAKPCYKAGVIAQVKKYQLNILTGARCREVKEHCVTYEKDGTVLSACGDTILYAVGMQSENRVYFDLAGKAPHVQMIGDCKKVGKVDGCIHSGFFAAMDIGSI